MRRRTQALLAACAVAPLALVALPAQAATTFTQNAFSVTVSGSSASLVSNIGANPTTTVNDAKFCTRDAGGAVVDYTAPVGMTVPSTGVTIRRTTVALAVGDYTSVPCVRVASTGSYTEVGARKSFTVAGSTPSPSPTPSPTPTVTPTPSPTPSPTDTPTPPTGGTIVLGRAFPDASTTGVPSGTTLTPYTGSCTIQVANTVIDAKTVSCDEMRVFAKGLIIKNSQINGHVYVDYTANQGSFSITDSTVNVGQGVATGLGDAFFTATRVEVNGGTRSINCYAECTVQDSWTHGQFNDTGGTNHESGVRINTNSHLIHNTITCDANNYEPDAGCSAAITGYPDFDPVQGNIVQNNLIASSTGAGYCAYGGSTAGKAYSGQTKNITFKDNIFRRGTNPGSGGVKPQCGYWGPITSFDVNAPGNVWSNNLWDTDGTVVPPAN